MFVCLKQKTYDNKRLQNKAGLVTYFKKDL